MKRIKVEDIELGQMLGTGTVGTVYLGRLKESGQTVAVKFLQISLSRDPLVRARFEREMEILEKLNHPHIIRYFGGGEHEGQLFYAMEPVTGGTVKELLDRFGSLSWREVASIARQVSSALQHAHNNGIIHRDLKPGNLFLDVDGNIKLGDFSIARDVHSADLTETGLTVGTHAYMAPEQITGDSNISGKADLYSLGCVLFEILAGRKPFEGTNFAILFEQHLHKRAPKVDEFVNDCPAVLSRVIEQLLAKDPNDRPFNARSVQGLMTELLAEDFQGKTKSADADASGDVGAATVIDPGMKLLARKLQLENAPPVSWRTMAYVGLVAVAIICIAAIAARN
jgi:serine/threonine protein kinase